MFCIGFRGRGGAKGQAGLDAAWASRPHSIDPASGAPPCLPLCKVTPALLLSLAPSHMCSRGGDSEPVMLILDRRDDPVTPLLSQVPLCFSALAVAWSVCWLKP